MRPAARQQATVLVVDDEPKVVRLIQDVLRDRGYRVLATGDGAQALVVLAKERIDLVLLDLLLPGNLNGYEICRRLREFSSVPVLMLTALGREAEKLQGFDAGTDDYMVKPFSAKELLARVEALLRRSRLAEGTARGPATLSFDELRINQALRRVAVGGREVHLTPTEYKLLHLLAVNAGRVVIHGEILGKVWGPEYRGEVEYLRIYIRSLRSKLETDPAHPRYIRTHFGVGYYLASPGEAQ